MCCQWRRTSVVWCCLAVWSAQGCHEEPPPQRYPENLGNDETRLLPTVSPGHDASILQGRTSVVEIGESAPAPQRPSAADRAADEADDRSGTREGFWGGLLGKLGAGASGSRAAPASPSGRGARGRGAPPSPNVPPDPEDEAAILEAFRTYRQARAEARFDELSQYLVEDQRASFGVEAVPTKKLCEALTEIRDDFADDAPQTVRVASTFLTQLTQLGDLGPIRMVDPNRAVAGVASVAPGAPPAAYTFERADEGWLMRSLIATTVDESNELADILNGTTQRLEELLDGLDSGDLDDAAAATKTGEILRDFAQRVTPIHQRALRRGAKAG